MVYLARDARLNRIVALKLLLSGINASAELVARFKTEAEIIARIDHANVVRIHTVGEQEGQPFLEMEYIEGEASRRASMAHPGTLGRRPIWSNRWRGVSRWRTGWG